MIDRAIEISRYLESISRLLPADKLKISDGKKSKEVTTTTSSTDTIRIILEYIPRNTYACGFKKKKTLDSYNS